MSDLSDNKKFWETVKPYFSNKRLNSNKMLLKEKGKLISDEKQLASIMNKFSIIFKKIAEIPYMRLIIIWKR